MSIGDLPAILIYAISEGKLKTENEEARTFLTALCGLEVMAFFPFLVKDNAPTLDMIPDVFVVDLVENGEINHVGNRRLVQVVQNSQ